MNFIRNLGNSFKKGLAELNSPKSQLLGSLSAILGGSSLGLAIAAELSA